jgi:hypothetical protein
MRLFSRRSGPDTLRRDRLVFHTGRFSLLALILLACLTCLHSTARAEPAGTPSSLKTEHYDIYVEGLDVADVGRMLEAFYPKLADFFGKTPPGPLRVEVYADQKRFESALRHDKLDRVEAGGFFSTESHKAYLWVQPSDYFTRQLILHECLHQFHYLAACSGKLTTLPLYGEGLAEHFGMHNWDGKNLSVGLVPAITLEDYPAKSLEHFRGGLNRDLEGMLMGKVPATHSDSWAVVHFLMSRYPGKFGKWADALNHHAEPADAWERGFGKFDPAMTAEFESWLEKQEQPWHIQSIAWQQRGDAIEGEASENRVSVALLKQTPQSLSVEIDPADTKHFMAGLVFGNTSPHEYYLLQLNGNHRLEILQLSNGKWQTHGTWPLPPAKDGAAPVLSLTVKDNSVELRANGESLKTVDVTGQVGLHVQEGTVLFRAVKID